MFPWFVFFFHSKDWIIRTQKGVSWNVYSICWAGGLTELVVSVFLCPPVPLDWMASLSPQPLHVRAVAGAPEACPVSRRCYQSTSSCWATVRASIRSLAAAAPSTIIGLDGNLSLLICHGLIAYVSLLLMQTCSAWLCFGLKVQAVCVCVPWFIWFFGDRKFFMEHLFVLMLASNVCCCTYATRDNAGVLLA